METWWIEVAKQIPAFGVLVYLVTFFLNHLKEVTREHQERVKTITDGHRAASLVQAESYAGQTAQLASRVTEALDRASRAQDSLMTPRGRQERRNRDRRPPDPAG